jgi:hypothetical protein
MLGISKHMTNEAMVSKERAVPIAESLFAGNEAKWTGTSMASIPIEVLVNSVDSTLIINPNLSPKKLSFGDMSPLPAVILLVVICVPIKCNVLPL